jgi:hypothetical protein
MTRVDVSDIEWGTPPPPKAKNKRSGRITPTQLAFVAAMRPGEWGCIEIQTANISIIAMRLRELGLEAVARGFRVYFRVPA